MKKYVAILIVAMAGTVFAKDYAVNVEIPVTQEVVITKTNVTSAVSAAVFSSERFVVDLNDGEKYSFTILGFFKDANGKVIQRKVFKVSYEQAVQMMPSISSVMEEARSAVDSAIPSLLAQ